MVRIYEIITEYFHEEDNDPESYEVIHHPDNTYDLEVKNSRGRVISDFSLKKAPHTKVENMIQQLEVSFPDMESEGFIDESQDDTFEQVIPGHMGMDFIEDVSINSTEVLAQYQDTGGDLERTLYKLESSNPSWRFILKHKGREYSLNLIKKIVSA